MRSPVRYYFKEWRTHKGLTQQQVAEGADLSIASISQLELGKQGASDRTLAALARVFGCEVGDLFRDPTRPEHQALHIIKGMRDDNARERAIRLLKAIADEAG